MPHREPDAAEVLELDIAGTDQDSTRRLRVLAAWASGPPGETLTAFVARAGIDRKTWWRWRRTPEFSAELERVVRHRARLNLEFFAENLAKVDAAVFKQALEGNIAAATLCYRRMGLLTEKVDLTTETRPEPELSLEELEAKLAMLQNVLEAGELPESS